MVTTIRWPFSTVFSSSASSVMSSIPPTVHGGVSCVRHSPSPPVCFHPHVVQRRDARRAPSGTHHKVLNDHLSTTHDVDESVDESANGARAEPNWRMFARTQRQHTACSRAGTICVPFLAMLLTSTDTGSSAMNDVCAAQKFGLLPFSYRCPQCNLYVAQSTRCTLQHVHCW